MSNYLIAGSSGSGKSATVKELASRGYSSYDTDLYPGAVRLEDKNGHPKAWPKNGAVNWDDYSWNWQKEVISSLLGSAGIVFIGGNATNIDNYLVYFDKIFVLKLNERTHKERILSRQEHDYGKHPDELAAILDYREELQERMLSHPNAVSINAEVTTKDVVDTILEQIDES